MRHPVALTFALSSILLASCVCAPALDPSLDISQYAHKSWTVREDFFKGTVISIAQTPDGYLWLGTEFGLLRFDGVRAVPWQPPPGQHLPSSYVECLLAARDGTLWIGTRGGLASWSGGKLTGYPEFSGQYLFALLQDREGTVWAGSMGVPPPGKLCAIHSGTVHCSGQDGSLAMAVFDLHEDEKGNLWAATSEGLWRWKPGAAQFYPLSVERSGLPSLGEDHDGTILISTRSRLGHIVDGKIVPYPLPGAPLQFQPRRLLRDRDGGLWIATMDGGLVHVHNGSVDAFRASSGLSGDVILNIFEDREGDVWVATNNGLDRFREFAVPTYNQNQGLLNSTVLTALADKDGGVWLGTLGGLNKWTNGKISAYEDENKKGVSASGKHDGRFSGSGLYPMLQDSRGRVWIDSRGQFGYLDHNRFTPVPEIPSIVVLSVAEDSEKNVWVANQDHGLFRLSPQNPIQQIPWAALGHKDFATILAADPQGGIWMGFFRGGVAYFKDGGIRASYGPADGLAEGEVSSLRFDGEGRLWAATVGGLSQFKNGRFATLTTKNGLPCDAVHWAMEDDDNSFWLYMPCGLVRVAQSEVAAWAAAVDKDKDAIPRVLSTVFDSSDGVRVIAESDTIVPKVTKSADGKLWFVSQDGVSVIDPRHLPLNQLAPPVHVEQVTADGKAYDASNGLSLPPHLRDLTIDYAALSLVAPEKVYFRYKLEGWDRDWQEAGTRRQAFYSKLPPRGYHFRVIACNNSGVWNEAGASLGLSVLPAFYQTNWFRALCVFGFLALLWGTYQLRVQQLRRQFNIGLEARVNERTRVARELHDTLLQSFQGLLPRLQAALNMLPDRVTESRKTLQEAVDKAAEAITEGRNAVQGMRLSVVEKNDLAVAVRTLGEELAVAGGNQFSPTFEVAVVGTPRSLHPILRDEVYRLVAEALRNAFRHAQARKIEVEIRYGEKEFRLQVRDNGRGIDPSVLGGDGREGHYGLHGMNERAKIVGGKLKVWSELDSGTEVELSIPALRAYAQPPRRLRLLQKLSRKDKDKQEKVEL